MAGSLLWLALLRVSTGTPKSRPLLVAVCCPRRDGPKVPHKHSRRPTAPDGPSKAAPAREAADAPFAPSAGSAPLGRPSVSSTPRHRRRIRLLKCSDARDAAAAARAATIDPSAATPRPMQCAARMTSSTASAEEYPYRLKKARAL